MKIKITCKGADVVDFHQLLNFQGGLKEMDDAEFPRLKAEVLEYGFNSPIHVWKHRKKLHILDGHQRLTLLNALEEEGYEIPPVPVDYIEAKSLKDAKHILLSRIKQYGRVMPTGLHQYLQDSNMAFDHVKDSFGDLPGINMENFHRDFYQPPTPKDVPGSTEVSTDSFSSLVHECPKCGFKFGKGTAKSAK